jgi:MoxR-like ATPase
MGVGDDPAATTTGVGRRFIPPDWWIYRGTGRPRLDDRLIDRLPPAPPWREFGGGPLPQDDTPPSDDGEEVRRLGVEHHLSPEDVDPSEVDIVNAALYLRRPLLVTGRPGTGKSALAYKIARELRLGRVLRWAITSRTTLKSGLYGYDAIGRAQAAATAHAAAKYADTAQHGAPTEPPIGDFIRLGPLGKAFLPTRRPRVLLIDEFDKSEMDLPNDLLGVIEDGQFPIQELARMRQHASEVAVFTDDVNGTAVIRDGRVRCHAFPVVIVTSNAEREFPEAFLRRCLQLEIREPAEDQLAAMVAAHLRGSDDEHRLQLIQDFVERSAVIGGLPANKLLDAVYMATSGAYHRDDESWQRLLDALWRRLTSVS